MPRFTTNDGVGLHYTDTGPTTQTGSCSAGRAGARLHRAGHLLGPDRGRSTRRRYRVVCFDRRSTGESDTPMFGQRMARHGRDLGEFLG